MRHDWNSLLSDDESLKFTRYSKKFFPPADTLVSQNWPPIIFYYEVLKAIFFDRCEVDRVAIRFFFAFLSPFCLLRIIAALLYCSHYLNPATESVKNSFITQYFMYVLLVMTWVLFIQHICIHWSINIHYALPCRCSI